MNQHCTAEGFVIGIAALFVGAPFEAVKTKQQHLGVGFRDGIHTIARLEGYLGIDINFIARAIKSA